MPQKLAQSPAIDAVIDKSLENINNLTDEQFTQAIEAMKIQCETDSAAGVPQDKTQESICQEISKGSINTKADMQDFFKSKIIVSEFQNALGGLFDGMEDGVKMTQNALPLIIVVFAFTFIVATGLKFFETGSIIGTIHSVSAQTWKFAIFALIPAVLIVFGAPFISNWLGENPGVLNLGQITQAADGSADAGLADIAQIMISFLLGMVKSILIKQAIVFAIIAAVSLGVSLITRNSEKK